MPKSNSNILLACTIIMLGGLLWSRAVLSISMGVLLIFGVYYAFQQKIKPFQHPLFIWGIAPVVLGFLGIYQQGLNEANGQFLLGLLIYPVACLTAIVSDKNKFATIVSQPWIHAALIALLYPIGWFVLHAAEAIDLYGKGQSLPVFMDTDHLRFSIFLCSALLFTLLPIKNARYKKISFAILLGAIIFLSVRTGWVIASIILVGFGLAFMQFNKLTWFKSILGIVAMLALLWFVPTSQQKIRYTLYDWKTYTTKGFDAAYSDGVRQAMNKVALKAIQETDAVAIGWSAIPSRMQQEFAQMFNGQKINYGWPFNQWLFWWMGSGWWGMLLFSAWLFYPAWYGYQHNNPFVIIWTIAIALSCLVETTLNYQYGAFLHVWPILVSWLTTKSSSE